jgi:hypothetical protein
MGFIVRTVLFLVGALGLAFTGLNSAESFGMETEPLLANLGGVAGMAGSAQDLVGSGLSQLAGMIGGATGEEGGEPGALATYGSQGIAAAVFALLMFFVTRR